MPSLSLTDYDTPDSSMSQVMTRIAFLKAIQTHAPNVIQDLKGEPLRAFQADFAERQAENECQYLLTLIELANQSCAFSESPAEQYNRLRRVMRFSDSFCKTLGIWARTYNIEKDWIFDHAIRNLEAWANLETQDDAETEYLEWETLPGWGGGVSVVNQTLTYSYPYRLVPLIDRYDEKKLRREIKKDFNATLDIFLKNIKREIDQSGLVDAPKKDSLRDFEWLVMYLCKKKTLAQIDGYHNPQSHLTALQRKIESQEKIKIKSKVFEAIKPLAKLLELPLPTNRRGRPKKVKIR